MVHKQDERRMLADSVAGFAGEGRGLMRARRLKAEAGDLDRAAWAEMADLGWLGILVPEAAGGLGLGIGELAVVAEGLGGDCAPEPFAGTAFAQAVLAGCDNQTLAQELLGATAAGERLVAVAWQGPDAAITLDSVTDRVDNGVLCGIRRLIQPVAADAFIVAARDDAGIALYRVAREADGLTLHKQTQVDGNVMLTLEFNGIEVTDADRLAVGANGAAALTRGLGVAHVAASAELLGLADALFDLTAEYLGSRRQFDQQLSGFQVLRHRMVDLYSARTHAQCAESSGARL